MRMYMWNRTEPWRDGAFEAGVVIHEYTHGLSNRLTGGPKNSGCLSVLESGGMGEGWGDFYATAIRLKANDTRTTDYPMGAWVYGDPAGLRPYVYSTNQKTNPHVYSDADALTKVHYIGTIWATMLYEVMWNLIEKHGKNDAPVPEFDAKGVPTDGKYLVLKLVLDGMALQPCNARRHSGCGSGADWRRERVRDLDGLCEEGARQGREVQLEPEDQQLCCAGWCVLIAAAIAVVVVL
jgi:extracellular elastinolytic metalloproteinase